MLAGQNYGPWLLDLRSRWLFSQNKSCQSKSCDRDLFLLRGLRVWPEAWKCISRINPRQTRPLRNEPLFPRNVFSNLIQISLRICKSEKMNILWEKGKSNFLCELVAQRLRLKMSEADEEKELSFSLAEKQKGKSWDMESFQKLFGRLFRITKRQAIHKTGHSWRRHYTLLNLSEKKLSWDSFSPCWDGNRHRPTSHWTSFWLILLWCKYL